MEITYMVVVALITLACGAITKAFIDVVPSKFIPLQNLLIGLISAGICFFAGVEENMLQAVILCVFASMGACRRVRIKENNDKRIGRFKISAFRY